MAERRVVYEVKKDLKTGEMVAIDHEKKRGKRGNKNEL